MEKLKKAALLLRRWERDERLRVYHMVLLLTFLNWWLTQNGGDTLFISRRMVMSTTRIGGLTTYHRFMKDLVNFGYIHYSPSYHPVYGSQVSLVIW